MFSWVDLLQTWVNTIQLETIKTLLGYTKENEQGYHLKLFCQILEPEYGLLSK